MFRPFFLQISGYGLEITGKIIEHYLQNNLKFSTVGDLGASLSVLKNSLRLCEFCKLE